jgi:membrane protease YdiL (CAAX protease family)
LETGPTRGNRFGIPEALLGLAAAIVLSGLALALYSGGTQVSTGTSSFGDDIVSLAALWAGFVGAAVLASRLHREAGGSVVADYGLRLRPWPDIPLGLLAGLGSQFVLVPLLNLPLEHAVPNFQKRFGHPTQQLLGPPSSAGTAHLVIIAILVCVGSPLVEELFFRGLLLRGLLGRFWRPGSPWGAIASVVMTGLVFALVHFEALQFVGLAGLGIVLSVMAWRTGRLGASVVAHVSFNTATVLAYVFWH